MEKIINEDIKESLRRIEDHLADMERSAEKDRQAIQDINVRLKAVEAQVEELRKATNHSAERIKNKVADAIAPITESTDLLTAQIKRSKMVVLKEDTRNWFQKMFRKGVIKK